MKISQLRFEEIENYDPFSEYAKDNGMVTEWAARNKWGIAVAFRYTKSECMADAGRYCKLKQEDSWGDFYRVYKSALAV